VKFWHSSCLTSLLDEYLVLGDDGGLPKACDTFWTTIISKCNFFDGFSEHGFVVHLDGNHYYTIVINFDRHLLSIEDSIWTYPTNPPFLPLLKNNQKVTAYVIVAAMDAACARMGTTMVEKTGKPSNQWLLELKPGPQQNDGHSCGPISLDNLFHLAFEYMSKVCHPNIILQRQRSPHWKSEDWINRRRYIAMACYEGVLPGYLAHPTDSSGVDFASICESKTQTFCYAARYKNACCSWSCQQDDMEIEVNYNLNLPKTNTSQFSLYF
jgi:hypothetical protein